MTSPDSWLAIEHLAKANPELTAEDIRKMSRSDWARFTGRPLMPVAAPVMVTPSPSRPEPESVPEAGTAPLTGNPEPVSVASMTPEQYAVYRKQIGIGQSQQYGVGILNAVSAPKASNGRHFMVNSNVEPSPAIARVSQVQVNEGNLDRRPLADRFGTASNAYRYEG